MTRNRSFGSFHSFDPEIDKMLNRIRKTKNIHVGHSSSSFNSIYESDICEYKLDIVDNPLYEPESMENNNRTLKELATQDVLYQPWCIQYLQIKPAQLYELKFGLIHLLPKFHDLAGEDPHKHLKELHVPVIFNIWGDVKRMFLEKFFSVSRTTAIQKEVCGIRQHSREMLHEYWERFNKSCAMCLHHQINEQLLL
ncbi:hypothetical protein CR513_41938, partial [Mucuna pruriens]